MTACQKIRAMSLQSRQNQKNIYRDNRAECTRLEGAELVSIFNTVNNTRNASSQYVSLSKTNRGNYDTYVSISNRRDWESDKGCVNKRNGWQTKAIHLYIDIAIYKSVIARCSYCTKHTDAPLRFWVHVETWFSHKHRIRHQLNRQASRSFLLHNASSRGSCNDRTRVIRSLPFCAPRCSRGQQQPRPFRPCRWDSPKAGRVHRLASPSASLPSLSLVSRLCSGFCPFWFCRAASVRRCPPARVLNSSLRRVLEPRARAAYRRMLWECRSPATGISRCPWRSSSVSAWVS